MKNPLKNPFINTRSPFKPQDPTNIRHKRKTNPQLLPVQSQSSQSNAQLTGVLKKRKKNTGPTRHQTQEFNYNIYNKSSQGIKKPSTMPQNTYLNSSKEKQSFPRKTMISLDLLAREINLGKISPRTLDALDIRFGLIQARRAGISEDKIKLLTTLFPRMQAPIISKKDYSDSNFVELDVVNALQLLDNIQICITIFKTLIQDSAITFEMVKESKIQSATIQKLYEAKIL